MLVALFFIAGATLAYQFQEYFIPLLLDPLHGEKLVYLNPAGGFSFIFLISIYAGIAVSFPILMQQMYAFLRPALPVSVRKKSVVVLISSFFLMLSGIAFGYFIAVPNALTFLYGFAESYINASLTAESYLNFIVGYTIGIGIVFQLPLLLMLRHTISPMSPGGLLKSEKWVLLGSFVVAAIITPTPDPVNQTIMAAPIIAVYQIGVAAVLFTIAKTRRAAKKANKHRILSDELFQNLIAQPLANDDELTALLPTASTQSTPTPLAQVFEDPQTDTLQQIVQQPAVMPTTSTPIAPNMGRPAFRSIDGIVRQPVVKPQVLTLS